MDYDVNEVFPSEYLKAADLKDKAATVTITNIEMRKMRDGENKLCLFFNRADKGMLLNKTNSKVLEALYGPRTGGWLGQKITIFPIMTDYQGQPTLAIRMRPPGAPTNAQGYASQAPNGQFVSQPAQQYAPAPVQQQAPVRQTTEEFLDDSVPF